MTFLRLNYKGSDIYSCQFGGFHIFEGGRALQTGMKSFSWCSNDRNYDLVGRRSDDTPLSFTSSETYIFFIAYSYSPYSQFNFTLLLKSSLCAGFTLFNILPPQSHLVLHKDLHYKVLGISSTPLKFITIDRKGQVM